MEGFHLTAFYTRAAAFASVGVGNCHEGCGHKAGRFRVALEVFQHLTAATAAAADVHNLLSVAGLQHQPGLVGLLKDFQGFLFVYNPTKTVLLIIASACPKDKAGFFGPFASLAHHFVLPAADAGCHQPLLLGPNKLFCLLVG
jgi:hypothetical protein